MKVSALYAPDLVEMIQRAVLASLDERHLVYHSPLCEPPTKHFEDFPNVILVEDDRIPPGRLVHQAIDHPEKEEQMKLVRSISFNDDDSVFIEYVDSDLSRRNGVVIHTAITIPMDEAHADDLEQLRAHAGILVAAEMAEFARGEDQIEEDDDDD